MTATEDVLAQIDDALDDWGVGPDAMRCGAPVGTVEADAAREAELTALLWRPEAIARWTLTDEPGGRP